MNANQTTKHAPGPLLDLGPDIPPATRQHWNDLADDLHRAQIECIKALAERDRYKAERDELLTAHRQIVAAYSDEAGLSDDTDACELMVALSRAAIAKIEGAL